MVTTRNGAQTQPDNTTQEATTEQDTTQQGTTNEYPVAAATPSVLPPSIAQKPPEFDGSQNVEDFIFLLTLYLSTLKRFVQDDDEKITVAGGFLRRAALVWFRSNYDGFKSFDDFKKKLRQQFQAVDEKERARTELDSLYQTHSVQAYTAKFREIGLRVGPEFLLSDEARHKYVKGLKHRTKVEVTMRNAKQLEGEDGIFAMAARFDALLNFDGKGPSASVKKFSQSNRDSREKQDPSAIQCYRCRKFGHKAYQCTAPPPPPTRSVQFAEPEKN